MGTHKEVLVPAEVLSCVSPIDPYRTPAGFPRSSSAIHLEFLLEITEGICCGVPQEIACGVCYGYKSFKMILEYSFRFFFS